MSDWLDAPQRIGAALCAALGAQPDEIIAIDNTTLNLHKLLAYGLAIAGRDGRRRFILYEAEGFPTDAHVVQGIVHHGGGRWSARAIDGPRELEAALGDDVAMVVLSHADYRSSRRWNMARVDSLARDAGVRVLWDLSHTAGRGRGRSHRSRREHRGRLQLQVPVRRARRPGPRVHAPRPADRAWPALPGWLGHADRMNFVVDYAPAPGMLSLVTGTMPVLQNVVAEAAAQLFARVDAGAARRQASLARHHAEAAARRALCGARRAARVAERLRGAGRPRGVPLPGWRPDLRSAARGRRRRRRSANPTSIRFGLAPATLTHVDVWDAVARLKQILEHETWREARFQEVSV